MKTCKWARLLAAGAFLLGTWAGAVRAADEESYESIVSRVGTAFWWGDFDALQREHDRYSRPGELLASGRTKLAAFSDGLDRVYDQKVVPQGPYLAELEALTLLWTRQHPNSTLAHAMYAQSLTTLAWSYRGSGFSNTVPPQAWQDFRAHVQRAADHMMRHADVSFANSEGHFRLVNIGRASGWPRDRLLAIAQAGLKLNPQDDRIHRSMLTSLLPKWGGSAREVDRYVNAVAQDTRAERGMEMYARLYHWAATDQFSHALFEDSGAEWPKMKQGYEDLLKRYPDPLNRNRFAYFACLAQDKATFLDQLERVGLKPDLGEWGENGARTFETCKRWASRQ